MPYVPTGWLDEIPGEDPITYDIEGLTPGKTIELHVAPTGGTPVDAANMNHIEHGIENAHFLAETRLDGRQGGSSTNWSQPGTSSTVPIAGDINKIQVGAIQWSGTGTSGSIAVTFPAAFAGYPLVICTLSAGGSLPISVCVSASTTGFTLYWIDVAATSRTLLTFNWFAIGPVAFH